MPLEPTKYVNGRMWQPGQSGNPNGRPVGSRTVFSQAFCRDLVIWSTIAPQSGQHTFGHNVRSNHLRRCLQSHGIDIDVCEALCCT